MVKFSNVRPFARTLYGKISTVYEISRGVNARLYRMCSSQQNALREDRAGSHLYAAPCKAMNAITACAAA